MTVLDLQGSKSGVFLHVLCLYLLTRAKEFLGPAVVELCHKVEGGQVPGGSGPALDYFVSG